MHDYNPEIFNLGDARLLQQPLYDEECRPVVPWQAPFVFAPGALITVEARLLVHHSLGFNPHHVRQSHLLLPSPTAEDDYSSIKYLPSALCCWTHPQSPIWGLFVSVFLLRNIYLCLKFLCSIPCGDGKTKVTVIRSRKFETKAVRYSSTYCSSPVESLYG